MKNLILKMMAAANDMKQKDVILTLKQKGLSNIALSNNSSSVLQLTIDWEDETDLMNKSDILLALIDCCNIYNKQQMTYPDRKRSPLIKVIRVYSEDGYKQFSIPVESFMGINRLHRLIEVSIQYYNNLTTEKHPETEATYLEEMIKHLTKSATMLEYRNQATDVARFIKNMYKAMIDDKKLQSIIKMSLIREFSSNLFTKVEINRLVPKVTNIIKDNNIGEMVQKVENCIMEDGVIKTKVSSGINIMYYIRSSVACDWSTPQTCTYKDIIRDDIDKIIGNNLYAKNRRRALYDIMFNSKFVDMVNIAFILANISK